MFIKISNLCSRNLRNTKTDLWLPIQNSANGQRLFPLEEQNFGIASQLGQNRQPPQMHLKSHWCHCKYFVLNFFYVLHFNQILKLSSFIILAHFYLEALYILSEGLLKNSRC